MTGPADNDDARTRRIMTLVAAGFTAAGLLGYLVDPRLAVVWAVLVMFGIAAQARVLLSKARELRAGRR